MGNSSSILITGDFCPVNKIGNLVSTGRYDEIFNNFLSVIQKADLAITNLECPLTDTLEKIDKIGPSLRAPAIVADILSKAEFKLVTLSNNHIMDYGLRGLKSTLQACINSRLDYVGAGEDYIKARQIYYRKVGGITVAILNFAENEFSTISGDYPGANPLDIVENYHDIIKAKANAEYVIVIVHGGHELFELPSPRMKKTFRFFADIGASSVIGHHSHCYSGFEVYNGVPIFYGLGNFIFNKPGKSNSSWNFGFAVELILNETLEFNIIPYEQGGQQVGIRLLDEHETELFNENIKRLNSIILNDKLLSIEFEKYCNNVRKMYSSFLEPHSIRFLNFLRNRKLFPSLLTNRKKNLYLNLIRCESHRDIVINLLDTRSSVSFIKD